MTDRSLVFMEVAKLSGRIPAHDKEISYRENEFAEIKTSLVLRCTAPLRYMKVMLMHRRTLSR